MDKLNNQRQQLSPYEKLVKDLNQVSQSLTNIEQQINNFSKEIEELPQEAHCPHQEVDKLLEKTKNKRNEIDQMKTKAQVHLKELNDRHEQYLQLEQDKKQAEHFGKLYKKLADLLDKNGIQLHILRNSERAIVDIANEILDGLSQGQIWILIKIKLIVSYI